MLSNTVEASSPDLSTEQVFQTESQETSWCTLSVRGRGVSASQRAKRFSLIVLAILTTVMLEACGVDPQNNLVIEPVNTFTSILAHYNAQEADVIKVADDLFAQAKNGDKYAYFAEENLYFLGKGDNTLYTIDPNTFVLTPVAYGNELSTQWLGPAAQWCASNVFCRWVAKTIILDTLNRFVWQPVTNYVRQQLSEYYDQAVRSFGQLLYYSKHVIGCKRTFNAISSLTGWWFPNSFQESVCSYLGFTRQ